MIAAITGANGCVGHALCRQLRESGKFAAVRALVREAKAGLPPDIEAVVGTLDDEAVLRKLCAGASIVFHAAAKVHDPHGNPEAFERVNVGGTAALLRAATTGGVARVIYFSTVAVYGETTPAEGIAEDASPAPVTPYAQTKLAGEALVTEWARGTGGIGVLLRLATVYGPRDRGNMARMLQAIQRGRFLLPGRGANCKTCVGVGNAVQMALLAALTPETPSGVPMVVADPAGAYPLCELAQAMARAMEVPTTRASRSVPLPLLLGAARIIEVLGARAPITVQQVERLAANNVYHFTRILPLLGNFTPLALSEGLKIAAEDISKRIGKNV